MAESKYESNDRMIKPRQIVQGPSRNDPTKHRIQLYLEPEEALNLAEDIHEHCKTNGELGVKLDIFIKKQKNSNNGKMFDSAFLFAKKTQPKQGFKPKDEPAEEESGEEEEAQDDTPPPPKKDKFKRFADEERKGLDKFKKGKPTKGKRVE